MARFIHCNSKRAGKSFIAINCGAIPEDLVESELFGYEKGAFTGARTEGKAGILEAANGGTVFLDEVGELSLAIQVKLLRALESRIIHHVGGTKNIPVDIRIISATNRNIQQMIQSGEFREDLYYRLNGVPIDVPALRNRREDIIPLVNHFLSYANTKYNTEKRFSNEAYQVLYHYSWPGNVRELKNIVERVVIMSNHDVISAEELPMHEKNIYLHLQEKEYIHLPIKERLERIEWAIMKEACQTNSSLHKAAKAMKRAKNIESRHQEAISQKSELLHNIEQNDDLKISPLEFHKEWLIEANDLSLSYGDKEVCSNLNFRVNIGDRVAIIGKNGSGKSSILKLINGDDIKFTGNFMLASGLKISYISQDTSYLKGNLSEFAYNNKIDETLFKTILRKLDFN